VKSLQKVAEIYLELGKGEMARAYIEKALAQAPHKPSLHVIKGFILLSLGNAEAAFTAANEADKSPSGKLGAAYLRAEGWRLVHDYDQAIQYFEQVANMDKQHYPALLSRLELYYLTGNTVKLKEILGKWQQMVAKEDPATLLDRYDRRWNIAGPERMRTIKRILNTSLTQGPAHKSATH